jgi:hypothetical protein
MFFFKRRLLFTEQVAFCWPDTFLEKAWLFLRGWRPYTPSRILWCKTYHRHESIL